MNAEELAKKYHREHITATPTLDWQLIWRLLGYLGPYKKWVILSVFLLLLARAIDASIPVYIGYITQKIINGTHEDANHKQQLLSAILHEGLIIFGLLALSYTLDTISSIVKSWVAQKALYTLRTEVYDHIQHLPLSYFDTHAVGHLMTRAIHDVEQINQMFTESIVPIIGSFMLFIGMFIGIAYVDWRVAIIFACILPIVVWQTNRFRYYQRYFYEILRNIVSAMNIFVQEHLMGSSTIRIFGLHRKERRQFEEINQDNKEANLETIHHFSSFIASIDLLQNFSLIAVFVLLVYLAPPGTGFQVGTYFTFSLYALMFFRPLADLAERYNVLQSAMAAAERIFTILDQPIEPKDTSKDHPKEEIHTISFEDVWFSYEPDHWILKGLTFQISKGEAIALVGVTGAGKTTIMSLLLRLYEFQKGSIKINGRDIKDFPLQQLRRHFSVVLQDPVIFSGTIFDNIALYQPEIAPARVESVINYVNLKQLVQRYPEGMYHVLTERGQSLSVGEMQLIALARAVAHERSMLILDEATANIDSITEQIIQDAMKKILKNKTALVIAHRLSTIKDATRIIVLREGKVAETGTHQELLQRKGIYEKLYRIQFTNGSQERE
jgi:ATP-binding cassette, subfamily B, multidrug efflux pump